MYRYVYVVLVYQLGFAYISWVLLISVGFCLYQLGFAYISWVLLHEFRSEKQEGNDRICRAADGTSNLLWLTSLLLL